MPTRRGSRTAREDQACGGEEMRSHLLAGHARCWRPNETQDQLPRAPVHATQHTRTTADTPSANGRLARGQLHRMVRPHSWMK
jgi:hypothetical protein